MLERAAGCLDFAGQGFWHKYRAMYRSKQALDPAFWKYQACESDLNLWQCILHYEANPCRSNRRRETSLQSTTHDTCLDFLFPPKCLLNFASWTSKSKRSNAYFQKRRRVINSARAYSHASGCESQPANATSRVNVTRNQRRAHTSAVLHNESNYEKISLIKASRDRVYRDNDRMWKLWQDGAQGPEPRKRLMARLSRSDRSIDIERVLNLLGDIYIKKRTAADYEFIIGPLLDAGHLSTVELICEEAVTQGIGVNVWSLTLKTAFQLSRWQDLSHIWNKGHDKVFPSLPSILASVRGLANQTASFLDFLQANLATSSDLELASCLVDLVFTSDNVMREISVESVLALTRGSSNLQVLSQKHYTYAIATLLRIETRSAKVMALVLYRNFRWHLSTWTPSQGMLIQLLETLVSLKTHYGVQYLLDEFTHFYEKPTVEAYKLALSAFSRSGDSSKTQETFDKLVEVYGTTDKNPKVDHKTPRTPRWVFPLLHAHARLGDFEAAETEFRKIYHVYKLARPVSSYNALISAHANARNYNGAFGVWQRMLNRGVSPNWHTYGTLMGLCAKFGDVENTIELCRMAEKMQGSMPTALMDTVVESYCRNQRFQEAEQVAEKCLSFAMSGSRTRMWNVMLWSHAFRADLDSVLRLQERMKQAGIEFDEMTYAALMLCFVIIGRPNSARRLLRGLQRGRRIQATEFHYTLVLYGFVKQSNRDMVYLIYKEIEERFRNPSMSARLLMMRSTLGRDTFVANSQTNGGFHLAKSEDLLFRAVFEFDRRQFANKYPRPGTSSLPANQAFPEAFYEPVLKAYSSEGIHFQAERLLKEYAKDIESSMKSGQNAVVPSLRFLSVLMEVYSHAENFETVQKCWELALERAAMMIKRPSLPSRLSTVGESSQSASEDIFQPRSSVPSTSREQPSHNSSKFASDNLSQPSFQDPSASPSSKDLAPESDKHKAKRNSQYPKEESIIPSQRFILARHFSLYIITMGKMGQAEKLPGLVDDYQKRGFQMTSQNWLTYVRTLASSNTKSEQLNAFTTFERIFMPHFPGWRRLARGVQLKPPEVPSTIDLLDKRPVSEYKMTLGKNASRLWSRLNPTWMRPTYNVMIYLAATLKDFRERSLTEGAEQLDTLASVAPLTLEAIKMMPHLREKFQGVLLRNHVEQGDFAARRRRKYVWTGGILGVGGTRRLDLTLNQDDAHVEASWSESSTSQATGIDEGEPKEHRETTEGLLEPRDEHDIETEMLLNSRQRELGVDPVQEEEASDTR